MAERPILFSAPMVRAILEGRKTVTRRVVKPQPEFRDVAGLFSSWVFKGGFLYPNAKEKVLSMCPYGQPGDRLWVRESFAPRSVGGATTDYLHYAATPGVGRFMLRDRQWADEPNHLLVAKWKPSIHMPRWASRITLEVTGVRVERLQDISEADAEREGIEQSHRRWWLAANDGPSFGSAGAAFRYLWEKINGLESWNANPWVWVVSFKPVTP